ncbi:serine O-acetyltransferase [Prevotella histicola]
MRYKECLDYIRSDYYRIAGRRDVGIFRMWLSTLFDGGFQFLFWLRLSNYNNIILGNVARLFYQIIGLVMHISIHRQTQIGYGLRIVHNGPIVINVSAIIGDNVDIYQNTTIGSMFFKAAQIGNNVYIGPSVCIVEDVKIGDGVKIGAGSVIVKDIEAGTTVAGNPAKVISHKEPGRLVWRRWNREWNKYNKK